MDINIHDLFKCLCDSSELGLIANSKWCSELLHSLPDWNLKVNQLSLPSLSVNNESDLAAYQIAKVFFDAREFDQCAEMLVILNTPRSRFLKHYAMYLSGEKIKDEGECDVLGPLSPKSVINPHTFDIYQYYCHLIEKQMPSLSPYENYLLGLCCIRLGKVDEAISKLMLAITDQVYLWSAWFELASLVRSSEQLQKMIVQLPKHVVSKMFVVQALMELQQNADALVICKELSNTYPDSVFLLTQHTLVLYNLRDLDSAIVYFEKIRLKAPYRLEGMDAYSNALYVKEDLVRLSSLMRDATKIDKYRPETCCIIGNYYSLVGEHDKAIEYFQRALRLNGRFLAAWTLLGHEYVEVKNVHAAIESYRRAIDVDDRDYRAWFGLGQAYELLRMPFYALYYYQKAAHCRPSDARMWIAMGSCYEALERAEDAFKCYQRGIDRTDNGHFALEKLILVCEKLGKLDLLKYYSNFKANHHSKLAIK